MNSQNTPHASPLRVSHGSTFYEFFGEKAPWDFESTLHLGDRSQGSEEGKTGPKPVSLCEMSPMDLPGLPRVKPFTVIMQAPEVYVSNLRIEQENSNPKFYQVAIFQGLFLVHVSSNTYCSYMR